MSGCMMRLKRAILIFMATTLIMQIMKDMLCNEIIFYWLKENKFVMAVCVCLYACSPVADRKSSP